MIRPRPLTRVILSALLVTAVGMAAADGSSPADDAALAAQAGTLIQAFAASLQSELKTAIAAGGLTAAIGVCRIRAPEIGQSLSTDGWKVGRTSLKSRNPGNRPDEWEQGVLRQFDAARAAGEGFETLVVSVRETSPEGQHFRLMKAIPTLPLCLGCHGSELAAEVQEALAVSYPSDLAVGYREGEVRGAFTLTRRLP